MDVGMTTGFILLAEDDDDHTLLINDAFEEAGSEKRLERVRDGEELMDFLLHRGSYQDAKEFSPPDLILLDLNLPKKDGRKVLKEIKSDPNLSHIPVIVLTCSNNEEDVIETYALGGNSFIRKPVRFDQFVDVFKTLKKYWYEVVELPKHFRFPTKSIH